MNANFLIRGNSRALAVKPAPVWVRYPDLPNRPDKTFGFNPGNSANPDTPKAFS
jgi:hypothetical protein